MSTNYYERLELATAPRPSAALLAGLAQAMRLTDDERAYPYTIGDQSVPVAPPDGELDFECEPVMSVSSGQQLVLLRPRPGTPTVGRLASLSRHLVRSGSADR